MDKSSPSIHHNSLALSDADDNKLEILESSKWNAIYSFTWSLTLRPHSNGRHKKKRNTIHRNFRHWRFWYHYINFPVSSFGNHNIHCDIDHKSSARMYNSFQAWSEPTPSQSLYSLFFRKSVHHTCMALALFTFFRTLKCRSFVYARVCAIEKENFERHTGDSELA